MGRRKENLPTGINKVSSFHISDEVGVACLREDVGNDRFC